MIALWITLYCVRVCLKAILRCMGFLRIFFISNLIFIPLLSYGQIDLEKPWSSCDDVYTDCIKSLSIEKTSLKINRCIYNHFKCASLEKIREEEYQASKKSY